MDPAEPDFKDTADIVHLDKSDAQFVDIIHSDDSEFNYVSGKFKPFASMYVKRKIKPGSATFHKKRLREC